MVTYTIREAERNRIRLGRPGSAEWIILASTCSNAQVVVAGEPVEDPAAEEQWAQEAIQRADAESGTVISYDEYRAGRLGRRE